LDNAKKRKWEGRERISGFRFPEYRYTGGERKEEVFLCHGDAKEKWKGEEGDSEY